MQCTFVEGYLLLRSPCSSKSVVNIITKCSLENMRNQCSFRTNYGYIGDERNNIRWSLYTALFIFIIEQLFFLFH